MRIVEFRIIQPLRVEEYQIAQLWSTAEVSRLETGGGEGVVVLANEPFNRRVHHNFPLHNEADDRFKHGQYTHKRYYLKKKVPKYVRLLAPKGALEIEERSINAYPYCKTIMDNPGYMKDDFFIQIFTCHKQDCGTSENVHDLSETELARREIVYVDIGDNDVISSSDYREDWDTTKFHSVKTGRGPLTTKQWWKVNSTVYTIMCESISSSSSSSSLMKAEEPIMCTYKLVKCHFKWLGLQTKIEDFIIRQEKRIFNIFHRQIFCWMDHWHGLTMKEVRAFEEEVKQELHEQLVNGNARGLVSNE